MQQVADPRVVEPLVDIQRSMRVVKRELTIQHRGPLPAPELLAGYEQVMPGLAERIVRMAEKEQDHRHDIDRTDLRQDYLVTRTGQAFGLIALVIIAALAAYLAFLGHPGWAVFAASIDIAAIVAVFVTGQLKAESEPSAAANEDDDVEDPEGVDSIDRRDERRSIGERDHPDAVAEEE